MKGVHSNNTRPEIKLRKALWHLGIRYRINYKQLTGKPDIAITRYRIAIFVDGDFWHGRNMDKIDAEIKNHRNYWIPKLKNNRDRDMEVNDILTDQGWLVLRFWESDINNDLKKCVNTVLNYLPSFINTTI
jgi:DNA mismatch endonuclease (patch repair protein)